MKTCGMVVLLARESVVSHFKKQSSQLSFFPKPTQPLSLSPTISRAQQSNRHNRHNRHRDMVRLSLLLPLASCFLFLAASPALSSNSEGEALCAFKSRLSDPNNVLQSWDQSLVNPCTWFHVTCDSNNRVIRLDLGNSNITGPLGPELGQLQNLQYLELYRNNFVGKIPEELGNLKNLVSMDFYENQLEGTIPKSLSKLKSLRFMRLNNNKLTGLIPRELATLSKLKVLDFSSNDFCGTIPVDGPFATFPPQSFENNKRLNGPELLGLATYDFGC